MYMFKFVSGVLFRDVKTLFKSNCKRKIDRKCHISVGTSVDSNMCELNTSKL